MANKSPQPQSGSVAILSLWAALFLSILAFAIASQVSGDLRVASAMKWDAKISGVAEKVLEDVIELLKSDTTAPYDSPNESWRKDTKSFKEISYGGGLYSLLNPAQDSAEETVEEYGLADEESKINLNLSSQLTLSRFFQIVGGMSSSDAEEIASFIVDWRDENSDLLGGQEGVPEVCSLLNPPSRCKNDLFDSLEELWWMPKMNATVYQKIKGDLTLHGQGHLNINSAGVNPLRSLGFSEGGAKKIVQNTLEGGWIFKDKNAITAEITPWGLENSDVQILQTALQTGEIGIRSDLYQARVKVDFGAKHKGFAEFIVNRNGSLKYWKEW